MDLPLGKGRAVRGSRSAISTTSIRTASSNASRSFWSGASCASGSRIPWYVRRGRQRGARVGAGPPPERRETAAAPPSGEADIVSELLAGLPPEARRGFRLRGRAEGHRPPPSRPRRGLRSSTPEGGRGRGTLPAAPRDSPQPPIPAARGRVALSRPSRASSRGRVHTHLDASREALLEDLTSQGKLSGTGLNRRFVTETIDTPGAEPWGAILGLYDFGPSSSPTWRSFRAWPSWPAPRALPSSRAPVRISSAARRSRRRRIP